MNKANSRSAARSRKEELSLANLAFLRTVSHLARTLPQVLSPKASAECAQAQQQLPQAQSLESDTCNSKNLNSTFNNTSPCDL